MAILCTKEQIKVDVSDTAHKGLQEMTFYDNAKHLMCFWNSAGCRAYFPTQMSVGPWPGTNASDIEVNTRCPVWRNVIRGVRPLIAMSVERCFGQRDG